MVSVLLFIVTFEIDVAAHYGHLTLPVWIRTGVPTPSARS